MKRTLMLKRARSNVHLWETMKGASSALLVRILGAILGFAVSVMVARMLGANGSGIYYLALSVATIIATISRVGFDNTVVRFVASQASAKNWGGVVFINRYAIKIVATASVLISLVVFLLSDWIANTLFNKPYMAIPLMLISVSISPISLSMIYAESLRGLKKIAASQWIKTVLISLGAILVLYPMVNHFGVNGAIASFLFGALLAAIAAWFIWHHCVKNKKFEWKDNDKFFEKDSILKSSWPLFWSSIFGLVIMHGGTTIVGILGTSSDVGIFNTANRVASLLLFPLTAMTSILEPKFAEMYKRDNNISLSQMQKLARESSRALLIFSLVSSVIVGLCADWIMSIFGAEFQEGKVILIVLLVGVVVNASTGAVAELLMMTGHEKDVKWIDLMGALMLITLCPLLMNSWNLIGAAIALSLVYVSINLSMLIQVKNRLGFWAV